MSRKNLSLTERPARRAKHGVLRYSGVGDGAGIDRMKSQMGIYPRVDRLVRFQIHGRAVTFQHGQRRSNQV